MRKRPTRASWFANRFVRTVVAADAEVFCEIEFKRDSQEVNGWDWCISNLGSGEYFSYGRAKDLKHAKRAVSSALKRNHLTPKGPTK